MYMQQDFILFTHYRKKPDLQYLICINCIYNNSSALAGRPTSGGVVTLKTGRWEGPGLNPGRACPPSRSEFSVVFSETRVNTG